MPGINQENLARILVPVFDADSKSYFTQSNNQYSCYLEASSRLTTTAKLLVEALTEGKLSEAELKEAQELLERGDGSADRAILSRLTRKGIDVAGEPPLFPDLDALYAALDQANDTKEQAATAD